MLSVATDLNADMRDLHLDEKRSFRSLLCFATCTKWCIHLCFKAALPDKDVQVKVVLESEWCCGSCAACQHPPGMVRPLYTLH
mmetsp:Transcript_32002/g.95590  ORF Transcript_32002/g.95590 Transcript_32002/m.95590 type:complete len:83 (+) Transcript_32002:382-630(+)